MLLVCFRKIAEQRGPRAATSSLLPQADLSGGYTIRGTSIGKGGGRQVSKQRWRGSERVIGRASQTVRWEERDSGVEKDETRGGEGGRQRLFLREATRSTSKYLHGGLSECILSFLLLPLPLVTSSLPLPFYPSYLDNSVPFVSQIRYSLAWNTHTRRIPGYFSFFSNPPSNIHVSSNR